MSDEITEDDIQENFSLKIEDYPLLKKFRGDEEFTSWGFLEEMFFFDGMTFKGFMYDDGDEIVAEIYPIFFHEDHEKTELEKEIYNNITLEEYQNNPLHEKLERFISQQLNFSGILNLYKENPENRNITFTFSCRNSNNIEVGFHNDSTLFNILTYFKNSPTSFNPVVGSEILFTDQSKSIMHNLMDEHGMYPDDTTLGRIPQIQKNILGVYKKGIVDTNLRGIYNSGDSLLLNDMLVKHSTLKSNEIIIQGPGGNKFIRIFIARNSDVPFIQRDVLVCTSRKKTKQEYIDNRGIIAIFVVATPLQHLGAYPGLYSFTCRSTRIPSIPEINFTKNRYGELRSYIKFLHGIRLDGCFKISETSKQPFLNPFPKKFEIKNRGGIKSKRKSKRKSKSDFLFYQK